jgi:hypothetical protein
MAVEKWVSGSTYQAAFGTVLDSLANGSAVASTIAIDNSSTGNIFCDLSISLTTTATASPFFLGVYLYPLNQDGTTYGDGRFSTGAGVAAVPPSNYSVGSIGLSTVSGAQVGSLSRIVLPLTSFKFVIYNQAGVALSTGNTVSYRMYNRQVV